MTAAVLPLGALYHLGFIARDLDAATAALGARYDVSRFRRIRRNAWLDVAQARVGEMILEISQIGPGAPALYADYEVDPATGIGLHHYGQRIATTEGWADLQAAIAAHGLAVPFAGEAMDGDLRFAFVDTRRDIGAYTEYVFWTGSALGMNDSIPRH